jgi:single-strand DNA-binding protein
MATRGVNECTVMGTIGKDAELREVNDKFNVIRLSLAINETWKDKQTGED